MLRSRQALLYDKLGWIRVIRLIRTLEGAGLISMALLRGNSYHLLHPPRKNSPLFLFYTCCGHPTNV